MAAEKFEPWIGYDLDGTLAEHGPKKKHSDAIGKPIPKMIARLGKDLEKGENVKIFTARVAKKPAMRKRIQLWLMRQGLPALEVTAVKDPGLKRLYDDRAVGVVANKGELK